VLWELVLVVFTVCCVYVPEILDCKYLHATHACRCDFPYFMSLPLFYLCLYVKTHLCFKVYKALNVGQSKSTWSRGY
jgi:hypothetical protein